MLWMLAPTADITVSSCPQAALKQLASTRRTPNLLLVDLCLNKKRTGQRTFLQIVSTSASSSTTCGAAFVDAMKDIEDDAQPALIDGRALVIALSSQALNRVQTVSLLHRGVHAVVQKPLTPASLRCAVGMVWE